MVKCIIVNPWGIVQKPRGVSSMSCAILDWFTRHWLAFYAEVRFLSFFQDVLQWGRGG